MSSIAEGWAFKMETRKKYDNDTKRNVTWGKTERGC